MWYLALGGLAVAGVVMVGMKETAPRLVKKGAGVTCDLDKFV